MKPLISRYRQHLRIVALPLLLLSCRDPSPPPSPPESFPQMLQRTEHVSCADITYHDYTYDAAPDCQLIYEAWVRGRALVARVYPLATEYKMVGINFYRPKLIIVPEKPYPLLDLPGNPRGLTYVMGGVQITYSYEAVIEHETVHALLFLIDGLRVREPSAVAADMGGYSPSDFLYIPFYFYLIGCHGTPDDPFGQPGNRASCLQPYQPKPLTGTRQP
jgi:hypothetical protein